MSEKPTTAPRTSSMTANEAKEAWHLAISQGWITQKGERAAINPALRRLHPNADVERMTAVAARHMGNLEAAAEEYLATTIFNAEPPSEAERAQIAKLETQAKGQLDMFEEQGQEDEPATVRRVTKISELNALQRLHAATAPANTNTDRLYPMWYAVFEENGKGIIAGAGIETQGTAITVETIFALPGPHGEDAVERLIEALEEAHNGMNISFS